MVTAIMLGFLEMAGEENFVESGMSFMRVKDELYMKMRADAI